MSSTKNKIVLKKLKELNTIWHPESTLVFKSSTDKVVVGRYNEGKLISLDDKALKLCEKWKFKYDKDLIEEEEEEEEEVEETNEEDIEEKEEEIDEKEDVEEKKEEVEEVEEKEDVEEKEEVEEKDEQKSEENEKQQSIQENSLDSLFIAEITDEYTKKIHNFFNDLSYKSNSQILDLNNEIVSLKNKFEELSSKYRQECSEHHETKDKLNKLQTKFDGIKQLFSL